MKRKFTARFLVGLLAGALLPASLLAAERVSVTGGIIEGTLIADSNVRLFRGVPFAAAPVGERRSTKDYYDALLGLRYRFDFSDRWALLTQADASFGDSEGTYLLRANLAWTVGKRQQNRVLFGYQYKTAEFKDDDLRLDFDYQGPMVGFNFRF